MKLSHDSLMKAELVSSGFWDLIKIRLPWLVIGLVGGVVASFIVSRSELSLRENISLAFFIPIIAYMSDAVGTQTETIFIRALTNLEFNIKKYVFREFLVGSLAGLVFGLLAATAAYLISYSGTVALVVGVSLYLSMSVATVLACFPPIILKYFGKDPAVGSGPFTTALQDIVSLTIYFLVAGVVLKVF